MPGDSNNEQIAPAATGTGALRAVDMTDPKDRALVHRALADWPRRFSRLTPAAHDEITTGFLDAVSDARKDLENPDPEVRAAARLDLMRAQSVARGMEQIRQRDEHAILHKLVPNAGEEARKGDAGPPTVIINVVQQTPKREIVG
jgi:hypothetical protein